MPPPSVTTEQFLRAIWGEGPGVAELTAIGPQGLRPLPFTYPDSLSSFLQAYPNHNRDSNVYMGVVLRKEPWPRNTGRVDNQGKPIIEKRGTEDNALSSMCVAFAEIDFTGMGHKVHAKTISEAEAKKRLHDFPLKPSIVVKSGGGIQIYWLGKEPIFGDDLWRMKAINQAVCTYLGADPQSVDLARILRIPGTMNRKYDPPRSCHISWWHPEFAYTLDDFDFLPVGNLLKPVIPPAGTTPGGAPTPAPPVNTVLPNTPSASSRPNPPPKVDLDEETVAEVGDLLAGLWMEGMRHELALCIAGMLVNRGVKLESARGVVARASNKAGGETDKRLKDVDSTYETWYRNEKVKGATELEAGIRQHSPAAYIDKSLATLEKVKKLLPKPPSSGPPGGPGGAENEPPNFKIAKLIMFNSKPARWQVTLEFDDGSQHTGSVETNAFTRYLLFRDAFLEDTRIMLMDLKNAVWTAMISAYGAPEVRDTPKEARPLGAVETAVSEFLEQARENAEGGTLQAFAGFDEDTQYFRFSALDNSMKNNNIRMDRHVVYDFLKQLGFDNTNKRVGKNKSSINVWVRNLADKPGTNGNGHGGGNGHSSPNKPVSGAPTLSLVPPVAPQAPVDAPSLFEMPEDSGPPPSSPSTDFPLEPGSDG